MSQDLSMSQRGDLSHYLDADWKSALWRKAFKIDLYQGNTRSWGLPSLSSVLSPEGIVTLELFLFFFFFLLQSCGTHECKPPGQLNHMIKLHILASAEKVEAPGVCVNLFPADTRDQKWARGKFGDGHCWPPWFPG